MNSQEVEDQRHIEALLRAARDIEGDSTVRFLDLQEQHPEWAPEKVAFSRADRWALIALFAFVCFLGYAEVVGLIQITRSLFRFLASAGALGGLAI